MARRKSFTPTSFDTVTMNRTRKTRQKTGKEPTGVRILVVEDEARLASLLRRGLTEEAHAVDLAADGEEALAWVDVGDYDAIVLDIMLPGIDGLEVCRRLRRRRQRMPLLLLTARDSVADRVVGLDAGADDYLVKPFAFAELAARLRAVGPASARHPRSGAFGWRGATRPDIAPGLERG